MHRYRINAPQVASQILDGEAVMIHFETGAYYGVDGFGAEILAGIGAGRAIEELPGDPAAIAGFVARLLVEDLVVPEPGTGALTVAPDGPSLRKFTDLAELLLLDPIHELGEDGWPIA